MVRPTAILLRIPAIKFKKGVGNAAGSSVAANAGSGQVGVLSTAGGQPAATMSTGAIPDTHLPARYRRTPLSEEEINHINGGGIPEPTQKDQTHNNTGSKSEKEPQMLGVLKIPNGVLIKSSDKKKEIVSLNIVLQKGPIRKK